jgi:lipoprotein
MRGVHRFSPPYPAAGYLLTLLGCTGAAYGRVLARRKEQAGARALSADSLLQGEVEFSAFQPQRLCNERGSRLGVLYAPICPVKLPA